MPKTEAELRSISKYQKANTFQKSIRFNHRTEQEMIDWLKDKPFSTYVKDLIRKDMEAHRK